MKKPKPGKTRKNSEVVGFHSVDWDDEWGDFLIYCFYLGFLDILIGSENKGFRESMRLFLVILVVCRRACFPGVGCRIHHERQWEPSPGTEKMNRRYRRRKKTRKQRGGTSWVAPAFLFPVALWRYQWKESIKINAVAQAEYRKCQHDGNRILNHIAPNQGNWNSTDVVPVGMSLWMKWWQKTGKIDVSCRAWSKMKLYVF